LGFGFEGGADDQAHPVNLAELLAVDQPFDYIDAYFGTVQSLITRPLTRQGLADSKPDASAATGYDGDFI